MDNKVPEKAAFICTTTLRILFTKRTTLILDGKCVLSYPTVGIVSKETGASSVGN